MKKPTGHTPPKWASRLLEWYCRPELLEDLQGDLHEYFDRNLANKGPKKAKVNFVLDVFKFIRPYTIRKVEILNNLTTTIMFKNYFKTSVRSIARNKLFSAINIIGLAISMSVCLLMISFISELLSYDKFHENADRVYRLKTDNQYLQSDSQHFASTSILAGKRVQEDVPGISSSVIMKNGFGGDVTIEDKILPISGLWATEDFFKVFTGFSLIQGNPETALTEPNSIVITQETAIKLFGTEDAVGNVIKLNGETDYTVTGIARKPPHNSHFTFESLGSMITYENEEQKTEDNYWLSWSNIWSNYVYLKLEENTDPTRVSARLQEISKEENSKYAKVSNTIALQPLLDIMPGEDLSNNMGKSMNSKIVWVLIGLTLVVILSAGFNYTNLSIARSLRRAKEVGIRKVVGATKKQIFFQFIAEAILIAFISLVFAVLLFYVIKPGFLNLNDQIQNSVQLLTSPSLFIYFILFTVLVGAIAGFFPAIFLSKLQAVKVLKGSSSMRLFKTVSMRKALIVVQFTLSLIFIISATIAYQQYKYALTFDLGFQTENVLNVRLQGNDHDKITTVFEAIPEVLAISKSSMIPSVGTTYSSQMKFDNPEDSTVIFYNMVDENYIPLFEHELLAGSNFDKRSEQKKEESIILNETALKRFNMGTPQEAIGKRIQLGTGANASKLIIRGVVKDFHYDKIEKKLGVFGFRYQPDQYYHLNLKVNSSDILGTMGKLETAWKSIDEAHDFNATFYDDNIERAYAQFSTMFTIIGFLAFITISIAALGLLGMSVYTAETKLKEISIRKVLGATEGSLIKLLARGFMWLLVIAAAIAVPFTYYFFDSVVLAETVNKGPIGFFELSSGVAVIFAIGLMMIVSQIWKAARSNPAQTLRSE